jgi:hypothetical protein
VALLSAASPGQIINAFHADWGLIGATGLLAAVAAVALGRVRARNVEHLGSAMPSTADPPAGRTATRLERP